MSATAPNISLRKFITGHFSSAHKRSLSDDDHLLVSGIVDSLGVLEVVAFIESEFGVNVADEDLIPENFATISRIVAYIENKQRNIGLSAD